MAAKDTINVINGKQGNSTGTRMTTCPCCGRKGLYKVPHRYERCRCCGLHRILLPGQDF